MLQTLLFPFSVVYDVVSTIRNYAYDHHLLAEYHSSLSVISVGNITVGGSGKSPLVQYLVSHLASRNLLPVILIRGYKGRLKNAHLVFLNDPVQDVGDEALMHAHYLSCPIVVSRDRRKGAKLIEKQGLGKIIILDDGFQHRRLHRDCDIVVIDLSSTKAEEEWKRGKVLPQGRFRESPRKALARADIIIFIHRGDLSPQSEEYENFFSEHFQLTIPFFHLVLKPICFHDAYSGEEYPLDFFQNKQGHVLTAIASGTSFCSMLTSLGITLKSKHIYQDHHFFTEGNWSKGQGDKTLPVFTTAKDVVKLSQFVKKREELFVLALGASFFSPAKEEEFWNIIQKVVT